MRTSREVMLKCCAACLYWQLPGNWPSLHRSVFFPQLLWPLLERPPTPRAPKIKIFIMRVKQCHKPSPKSLFLKVVYKNHSQMGGLWHCFTYIRSLISHRNGSVLQPGLCVVVIAEVVRTCSFSTCEQHLDPMWICQWGIPPSYVPSKTEIMRTH